MPTAPKTYHYHFINLTYLLYLFVTPTPYSTIHPPTSHPNQSTAALPDAQHPLRPRRSPRDPRNNNEKGPKTGVPPARRQGPSPPRPQPARAHTRRGQSEQRNCEPNIPGRALQGIGRDATRLAGAGLRRRKGRQRKTRTRKVLRKKKTVILPFLWCG